MQAPTSSALLHRRRWRKLLRLMRDEQLGCALRPQVCADYAAGCERLGIELATSGCAGNTSCGGTFCRPRSNNAAGAPDPIDREVIYETQHSGVVPERVGAWIRLLEAAIDFAHEPRASGRLVIVIAQFDHAAEHSFGPKQSLDGAAPAGSITQRDDHSSPGFERLSSQVRLCIHDLCFKNFRHSCITLARGTGMPDAGRWTLSTIAAHSIS